MAPLILRPASPAHGGAAVARDDGKVWLVNYALPGEVVEAEPRGRQGGVAVADATRVIEASPHRVTAPCPYFGQCGGCQLQHAAYAHQLELKRQVVEEAWSRAGLRLPPDTAVLGMDDPWRYRIRGEFEALASAGGWRFGFHRMRSHSVLSIDSCLIHDRRIESALPAFAQAANELELKGLQHLLLTVEQQQTSGTSWNTSSRPAMACCGGSAFAVANPRGRATSSRIAWPSCCQKRCCWTMRCPSSSGT